jgi:hypothetical protein
VSLWLASACSSLGVFLRLLIVKMSGRGRNNSVTNTSMKKLRNNESKTSNETVTSDSYEDSIINEKNSGKQLISISVDDLEKYISTAVNKAMNELSLDLARRLDFIEKNITQKFQNIEADTRLIINNVDKMGAKIDKINTAIAKNESNTISAKSTVLDKPIEMAVNFALREQDERESKSKNIILFNIPESENKDFKIRIDYDIAKVKEITDTLEINPVIEKVIRLGKFDENKQRPLLLKLLDTEEKEDFLINAKKLGRLNPDDPRKRVVIKKDLTKNERELEKILVVELKERRTHGEKLVIRNGKIVTIRSQ